MRTTKQTIIHIDPKDRVTVWIGGIQVYFDNVEPDAPLIEVNYGAMADGDKESGLSVSYGNVGRNRPSRRIENVNHMLIRYSR